jgi:protein NRD1
MLTAEYGGTGGRQIESGMVVEEPDIEIGAGVSSKAISRRIATDTGGKRGPISTRTNPNPNQDARFGGRREREGYGAPEPEMPNMNNPSVAPAVPAYGFNFASMPMLPPGFMMGQGSMPGSQPPSGGQGN